MPTKFNESITDHPDFWRDVQLYEKMVKNPSEFASSDESPEADIYSSDDFKRMIDLLAKKAKTPGQKKLVADLKQWLATL